MIDIHTHGIGGYDTKTKVPAHISRIAEMHGASGVSEILLSIYPGPVDVMRQQMGIIRQAMERQDRGPRMEDGGGGVVGRRPSAVGGRDHGGPVRSPVPGLRSSVPSRGAARIIGLHLEGPFLNPAKSGALNPRFFVEPREKTFRELVEGFEDIVKVITVAPELKGALALIRKMASRGIVVSMGHSDATYAEAEAGWKAGAQGITHLFNAMSGFHHREPGLAGFGLLNNDVYVEVVADPFHLHARTIELIFSVKKAERIILVSDSVKETRTGASNRAVASHSGVLQGGATALPESCQRLLAMGFDETVIGKATTLNPRRYLGLQC